MSRKQGSKYKTPEWLEDPWKIAGAAFSIATVACGIGFSAGIFKEEINCKMEVLELKREYDAKLFTITNECREAKTEEYKKEVEELKETFKEIKKNLNEE